jgi:hypothetical protein
MAMVRPGCHIQIFDGNEYLPISGLAHSAKLTPIFMGKEYPACQIFISWHLTARPRKSLFGVGSAEIRGETANWVAVCIRQFVHFRGCLLTLTTRVDSKAILRILLPCDGMKVS